MVVMRDEEVRILREVNEAVARGDPAAVATRLHPDVVWEQNIGTGSPEEGVYRGREAVVPPPGAAQHRLLR
jgi:ketosteroid isomerase-like protein